MRKGKLITAVCMLVMTIACLTFGVLALTTSDFTVAGTVTFNNYKCDVALDVRVLGLASTVEGVTQDTTTKRYYKDFKFTTEERTDYTLIENNGTMQLNELTFDELNTQIEDNLRSEITISITLHNYSTYDVELSAELGSNIPSALTVTLSDGITATKSTDGTTAQDATNQFTIILKANSAINAQAINFANVSIKPYEDPYKDYTVTQLSDFTTDGSNITQYNGTATKLIIPDLDGITGTMAVANDDLETTPVFDKSITEVAFTGRAIKTIGAYTFSHATALKTVVLPESLESIGKGSFNYCSSLTTITIPNCVTSIGNGAFDGCPDSLFTIIGNGKYLTDGTNPTVLYKVIDKSITSFDIPSTVKAIYDNSFSGCTSLTTITIPSSVTSIGSFAFRDCTDLNTVYIDSAIAKGLTSKMGSGYIINNMTTGGKLYIKSDITTIGGYVTNTANFSKGSATETVNETEYWVYTKV